MLFHAQARPAVETNTAPANIDAKKRVMRVSFHAGNPWMIQANLGL